MKVTAFYNLGSSNFCKFVSNLPTFRFAATVLGNGGAVLGNGIVVAGENLRGGRR
jgi:hypothetical protein